MKTLTESLDDYFQLRHSLGYNLDDAARLLPRFVAWMAQNGHPTVTVSHAITWVELAPAEPGSTVWPRRMTAVRGFARYLSGIDPATEVPPIGLFPSRQRWSPPFIFTTADIAALTAQATGTLDARLPSATYATLIGLLTVTGLRIGEAIRLDGADVDLTTGVLLIRESKFAKTRIVPLRPSTVAALHAYAAQRDKHLPSPTTPSFFVTVTGKRLLYPVVQKIFHTLCSAAGIGVGAARGPRLHDLRHTFAITTLINWYRTGADVHARLPYLSTYLGHREPRFTYWYLSAAPELLALAAGRLDTGDWQVRS
ncbi:tyrosine-type recombinase/integrase [Cryobacterium sp. TMT3-29-2]|uniref:tyrosine-type recombinase/integrase n=1 Tax=Cryobacterium sp. TMT3-29-2 TaxID=2555867 RepID=UPI0010745A58|nr:tyrosine-type recombinase/integrase [Cryobacterium sp. TMT3-29-2]TFC83135.1 integrase [Cryobacterium sp. TMT3-29-2]